MWWYLNRHDLTTLLSKLDVMDTLKRKHPRIALSYSRAVLLEQAMSSVSYDMSYRFMRE